MAKWRLLICLLLLCLLIPSSYAAITKLSVSANKRYLVNADNTPVYLIGGTAWTMPENADRSDVNYYIADRKSKGYNYFQIVAVRDLETEPLDSAITTRTMNPTNRYGHEPFEWKGAKADPGKPVTVAGGSPTSPNDYWDHLDYIVQKSYSEEMYIGILPTWGIYYINHGKAEMRLFTTENAKSYGKFLGDRYKSYPHIIWILGGDVAPYRHIDAKPIYRAMAEGIVEGMTGQSPAWNENHAAWNQVLITYHGKEAAALFFNDDAWLKLNMVYMSDPDIFPNMQKYYSNTPTRPMLEGESRYEGWIWDGTYKDRRLVRRQHYHVLFGGATGDTYGSAMLTKDANDQMFRFQPGWRNNLDLPGASDMTHVANLVKEHDWWKWIPDQSLIRIGEGSGENHKAAVRSTAGDELLVYFPSVNTAKIDLTKITVGSRVKATWYDPRNGNRKDGGVFRKEYQDFIPPLTWEDAVLILEDTEQPITGTEPTVKEFKTINGEAVIAAEDYSYKGGTYGTWIFENSIKGYLGSGYMRSSTDTPSGVKHLIFNPNHANLNYVINFDKTGKYYIHLRTFAYDHTENGFFAALDGKEVYYGGHNPYDTSLVAFYIFVKTTSRWNWYTDGGGAETQRLRDEGRPLRVTLQVNEPGRHTFSIYRRDTNTKLDHIWITQSSVAPVNSGTISLKDPALFKVTKETSPVCGDRDCSSGFEDCASCPEDCGICPTPEPRCGDTNCDHGLEDCASCPADCGVCTPTSQSIVSFSLIDAFTEKVIRELSAYDKVNLYEYPNITIRANTNPTIVGSVQFKINDVNVAIENAAPYTIAGDKDDDYFKWDVTEGSYTITASPYTLSGAAGMKGTPLSIYLVVIDEPDIVSGPTCGDTICDSNEDCSSCPHDCGKCTPTSQRIESFSLINAETGQVIRKLSQDDKVNLHDYPKINIRANTDPSVVGSVQFEIDGSVSRIEKGAPYTLAGDYGGDYNHWDVSPKKYTITATPFELAGATGIKGTPLSIQLDVRNDEASQIRNLKINPKDDAYLENSVRKNDEYIKTRILNSPIRTSYLKFQMSEKGVVYEAKLRLKCVHDPGYGTLKIYLGSDSSWTEDTLTTTNKPSKVKLLDQKDATFSVGSEYIFDVTAAFSNLKDEYNFILEQEDGNDVAFSSSEGVFSPELSIAMYSIEAYSNPGSCISLNELLSFIQRWKAFEVDRIDVENAIKIWKEGCS